MILAMVTRYWLVLNLLSVLAAAGDDSLEAVADAELAPGLMRLEREIARIEDGSTTAEAVADRYCAQVDRALGTRQKAISTYLRAMLLLHLRKLDDSESAFEDAIRLWPRFPAAHYGLAGLAGARGDMKRAQQHLRATIEIDPKHSRALIQLGEIEAGEADTPSRRRALSLFRRALIVSETPQAYAGIATVCARLGRAPDLDDGQRSEYHRQALEAAEALLRMAPQEVHAHFTMVDVLAEYNRKDDAVNQFERSYRQLGDRASQERLFSILVQRFVDAKWFRFPLRLASAALRLQESGADEERYLELFGRAVGPLKSRLLPLAEIDRAILALDKAGTTNAERLEHIDRLTTANFDELRLSERFLRQLRKRILVCLVKQHTRMTSEEAHKILKYYEKEVSAPSLMPVLAYLVHGNAKEATPSVRVHAIRTLPRTIGIAAIPTLLYCLDDEDESIARSAECALVAICETSYRESSIGGVPRSESSEDSATSRWRAFFATESGTVLLTKSIQELKEVVPAAVSADWSIARKPLLRDVIHAVLTDPSTAWSAWREAYALVCHYAGEKILGESPVGDSLHPEDRSAIAEEALKRLVE
jgi:tetratricopeptide (TPR) repeat protein